MSIEQFLEAMEIERNEQRYRKYKKELDEMLFEERFFNYFDIEKVIFNNPATIVIWKDGTKTVVKCNGEKFDQEKGLAMAISKRALAVGNMYRKVFKKWCKAEDDFSEKIKKDPRFKNIKVKADFLVEEISEDKPLRVGEKVIVLATGEDLEEYIIPIRYSLEIGKAEKVDLKSVGSKVRFSNGDCWWFPNKFLRRVVVNAKTK